MERTRRNALLTMLSAPAAAIAAAPVIQTATTPPVLPFTLRAVLPATLQPWEAEILAYVESEPRETEAGRDTRDRVERNETDEEYDMREPGREAVRKAKFDAKVARFGREGAIYIAFLEMLRFHIESVRMVREDAEGRVKA